MRYFTLAYVFLLLHMLSCRSVEEVGVLVPPTVDQDPGLPHAAISVAGHTRLLHVRTYGDSTSAPLFLLHGSYTDTRAYQNLCDGLSDKYYVIIWDQRGCGLSERITEEEFTFESTLEEIRQMKTLYAPDRPITLLGQSWGGALAAHYTASYPDDIAQLVLIEPMPLTGADMQQVYKTIVDFHYNDRTWNNLARQGHVLSPDDHAQIDYRAMMILRSTMTANYHCDGENSPPWPIHRVGGYLESVRNKRLGNPYSGFSYDFTAGLTAFNPDVLILGGSCSSLGYDVQLRYTQPHFTSAHVIEIKNAGHRMNIEQYDTVMQALRNYLQEY